MPPSAANSPNFYQRRRRKKRPFFLEPPKWCYRYCARLFSPGGMADRTIAFAVRKLPCSGLGILRIFFSSIYNLPPRMHSASKEMALNIFPNIRKCADKINLGNDKHLLTRINFYLPLRNLHPQHNGLCPPQVVRCSAPQALK